MHLRFAVKGVARPALETRCLFSSGSQSMFCEWKGMRGSRLSESAEEECTVHLRSRPPSFSLGCVCMCCSGLRGLEDQQSFLARTPGIGSLENITRGLCPLPPPHPSDLTDGLHLLPLFPQLGHPRSHTHLANIPRNKNTILQQTDHAWWTSGQASPTDHPHPAPRPKALASHTELVTGQASWLSF